MGLDLWFREDIARILAATAETLGSTLNAVSPLSPDDATAYQQGFEDALRAVGIAFGVGVPPAPSRPSRRANGSSGLRLIEAETVRSGRYGGREWGP